MTSACVLLLVFASFFACGNWQHHRSETHHHHNHHHHHHHHKHHKKHQLIVDKEPVANNSSMLRTQGYHIESKPKSHKFPKFKCVPWSKLKNKYKKLKSKAPRKRGRRRPKRVLPTCVPGCALDEDFTVDFAMFDHGDRITTDIEGISVNVISGRTNMEGEAVVFDSSNSDANETDDDLVAAIQASITAGQTTNTRVLIIQEIGATLPDDEGEGGIFTFVFACPVVLTDIAVYGIGEGDDSGTIVVTTAAGEMSTFSVPDDREFQVIDIGVSQAVKMDVNFVGFSGAISDINLDGTCKSGPTCRASCDVPAALTMDFSQFFHGDRNPAYPGVTIFGDVDGVVRDVVVFDTTQEGTDDRDLEVDMGNTLILQEEPSPSESDPDDTDPDDEGEGGSIIFIFECEIQIISVTVVDTEDGGEILLFDDFGRKITKVYIPQVEDGEGEIVEVQIEGVAKMVVYLEGAGAIANIETECKDCPTKKMS